MDGWLQENDWKYLKGIRDELLQKLCARINQQSSQILADTTHTPHEKYKMLYDHMKDSDEIVADCFDDWRRSRLGMKITFLKRHKLLTDEQVEHLSDNARTRLAIIEKALG